MEEIFRVGEAPGISGFGNLGIPHPRQGFWGGFGEVLAPGILGIPWGQREWQEELGTPSAAVIGWAPLEYS